MADAYVWFYKSFFYFYLDFLFRSDSVSRSETPENPEFFTCFLRCNGCAAQGSCQCVLWPSLGMGGGLGRLPDRFCSRLDCVLSSLAIAFDGRRRCKADGCAGPGPGVERSRHGGVVWHGTGRFTCLDTGADPILGT